MLMWWRGGRGKKCASTEVGESSPVGSNNAGSRPFQRKVTSYLTGTPVPLRDEAKGGLEGKEDTGYEAAIYSKGGAWTKVWSGVTAEAKP